MIIGITGYSGFLGTHLVENLFGIPNVEILLIGRKPPIKTGLAHHYFDFHGKKYFNTKVDTLIHLAGITGINNKSDLKEFDFNYVSTKNLLDSFDFRHIVFASTLKINESKIKLDPINASYINSKLRAEKLIEKCDKAFTVLRVGPCYGRYDLGNRLIPKILKSVITKHALELKLNSHSELSLLSGDDFSKIVESLIFDGLPYNQTIDIYNPNYVSVSKIINIIHKVTGEVFLKTSSDYPILKPIVRDGDSSFLIKNQKFTEFEDEFSKIWNIWR